MKILTLNARVWTRDLDKSSPYYWRKRMEAMNAMIEHIHPDVICLQEMSFPANLYIPREYRKCGLLTASHHIYCRRGMKVGRTGYRIHWNYAEIGGTTVICVHGTWKQKMEKICRRILHFKRGRKCVIAGDFNINLRKCWDYGFPFSARSMTYADEIETFRNFSRPDLSNGEIDHVFFSGLGYVESYAVIRHGYGAERISDHYPVVVELNNF